MAAEERKPMKVEERLAVNETRTGRESHLAIEDTSKCSGCEKPCLTLCPAATYSWSEELGRVVISFENCLECGACRCFCPHSVIIWKNPMGGTGVCYRYG